MFVQVIEGRTSDPEAVRRQMDRWMKEIRPGAEGFLGSTAGVTDDGRFLALARFESEDAARRNSDRPEQATWWDETAGAFEGEVTFHDCPEVEEVLGGGSDDAGFVQIMQGRSSARDRLRKLEEEALSELQRVRPEVIGGIRAWDGDFFTEAVYFRDEQAAREGEQTELPDDVQSTMTEWDSLIEGITYHDLHDPWLY